MSTANAATEEERGAAPTEASLQRSHTTAEQQGMNGKNVESTEHTATAATLPSDDAARTSGENQNPTAAGGTATTVQPPQPPNPVPAAAPNDAEATQQKEPIKNTESNENTATDGTARSSGESQNPASLNAPTTAVEGGAATATAPVPPNPHHHLMLIRQEREFLEHQHALTLQKEQLLLQQVKGLPPKAAGAAAAAAAVGQQNLHPNGDSNNTANQIQPLPKKKDTKWLATYEELLAYKRQHGDCVVPRGYPPNPRLASWVAENRKQYVRTNWLVLPMLWHNALG